MYEAVSPPPNPAPAPRSSRRQRRVRAATVLVSVLAHALVAAAISTPDRASTKAAGATLTLHLVGAHPQDRPAATAETPPSAVAVAPQLAKVPSPSASHAAPALPSPPPMTAKGAPPAEAKRAQTPTPKATLAVAPLTGPTRDKATASPVAVESERIDRAAECFDRPPPRYPSFARRRGLEGEVHLRISLSAEGDIDQVQVTASSGSPALDQAAVRAVRTWRCKPKTQAGVALASTADQRVDFHLRQ